MNRNLLNRACKRMCCLYVETRGTQKIYSRFGLRYVSGQRAHAHTERVSAAYRSKRYTKYIQFSD